MVTADHRINHKCTLGHFYNSRDPTSDWLANFAIAKISAGSIFTDSQNFGPRNNNPLYGIPNDVITLCLLGDSNIFEYCDQWRLVVNSHCSPFEMSKARQKPIW